MDLIPKPRCKSDVWKYFGLIVGEDGKPLDPMNPVCRLCRKIVHSKNGSTTNLRAHLRSRHQKLMGEPREFTGLDYGSESSLKDGSSTPRDSSCTLRDGPSTPRDSSDPLTAPHQNYVSDAAVSPLETGASRAVLSVPFCLDLRSNPDLSTSPTPGSSSSELVVGMRVHAKVPLQDGMIFGPFVGEEVRGAPGTSLAHAWIIREDSEFYYVDATDENKSNWMRYVSYAPKQEDHNLVVMQLNHQIYYKTSKPISEGAELKVWIGEEYAGTLCLDVGDTRCDFGKKESILRLYLDVQLVTLEEPSSSLWFHGSQSQDPTPLIHKVTSTSNPYSAADPVRGTSSSIQPSPHPNEEYNFFPGTENLLNHPTRADCRLWYFYGFRPQPSGQPVDWRLAVCKLCGEQVAAVDTIRHLNIIHEINSQSFLMSQIRSQTSGQRSKALGPVLSGFPDGASTPPMHPQTVDTLTNVICNFLIRDLHPPTMVEGPGFRELMRSILPAYKELASVGTLEALLKELHIKERTRLLQGLRCKTGGSQEEEEEAFDDAYRSGPNETLHCQTDLSHLVTLSADLWLHAWQGGTSRNATLWVHYIDENFQSWNWALSTRRLADTEGVEAQVKAMALEWGILHSHLVLLGGDLVTKGTVGLERQEQSGDPDASVDHLPRPHIPCFYAAIQACIEDVMSFRVISETLRMFQEVLSGLFSVGPRSNPFQFQIQLLLAKIPQREQARLRTWAQSPPGWKSLFTAINILIKHKKVVSELIKFETGTIIKHEHSAETDMDAEGAVVPGEPEWKVLQVLCSVLKPTEVACRTLAKEAFPRLSLIKPVLVGLLTRHLAPQAGDATPLAMELRTRMRAGLAGFYQSPAVNRVLCVACSLDPQFRSLGFMEAKEQSDTRNWLKEEASLVLKEAQSKASGRRIKRSHSLTSSESYDNGPRRSKRIKNLPSVTFTECEDEDPGEGDSGADEAEADSDLSGMQFLLGDLLGSPGERRAAQDEEDALDSELALYVADKRPPPSGVEPLDWWKSKTAQFPLLAEVARVCLAAPAVAGSAAQDFSAGDVNSRRRNMPPESLAEILFLHHNNVTAPTD